MKKILEFGSRIMKSREILLCVIIILSIVVFIIVYISSRSAVISHSPPSAPLACTLFTVHQQQEKLNSLGNDRYKCEVDGIAGPEFSRAINNWSMDQDHIRWMENK